MYLSLIPQLLRPCLYSRTDVFWAVVSSNHMMLTPPRDDLLELANDPRQRHGKVRLYTAVLGAPLIERRCAHTQLSANVGYRKARFDLFDRIHDLSIGED